MNNNIQISDDIIKIFKFYDTNKIKHKHFIKQINSGVIIGSDNDSEKNKIQFFDTSMKDIGTYQYDVIGFYYNKNQMWNWSWVVVQMKKNEIELTKNILKYGIDIDWKNDNQFFQFLKLHLVNPRIKILNYIQLELILGISIYISKKGTLYKKRYFVNKSNPDDYYDEYTLVYI